MPKMVPHAREDILETSRALLKDIGYEAFNMRALALQCHISVGTLYNHFPSKYDIVASIMQKDWGDMLREMDGWMAREDDPAVLIPMFFQRVQKLFRDTHGLWVENAAVMKDVNMEGVRFRRMEARTQLAERLACILKRSLPGDMNPQEQRALQWRANGFVRLLLSYCGDTHAEEGEAEYNMNMLYESIVGGNKH